MKNVIDWSSNHIYISKNILDTTSDITLVQNIIRILPYSIASEGIVSDISIKLKLNPDGINSSNIVSNVTVTDIIISTVPDSIINNNEVSVISIRDNSQIVQQQDSNSFGGGGYPSSNWKKYALKVKRGNDPDFHDIYFKPLKIKKALFPKSIISKEAVSKVTIKQKKSVISISTYGIDNKSCIEKISIKNNIYIDDEEVLLFLLAA